MIKSSKLASATLVSLRLAWAPWNPDLTKQEQLGTEGRAWGSASNSTGSQCSPSLEYDSDGGSSPVLENNAQRAEDGFLF